MASAAVSSKVVVLLLLTRCLLLLSLQGFCVCVIFCCAVRVRFLVLQSSWWGRERAVFFTLFVFLLSCDCYCAVALPQGTRGRCAVYNCSNF